MQLLEKECVVPYGATVHCKCMSSEVLVFATDCNRLITLPIMERISIEKFNFVIYLCLIRSADHCA